ncbi:MAG: hypothetical protein WB799_05470, partial [Candidatus Sulfotelmatobacter sp.]
FLMARLYTVQLVARNTIGPGGIQFTRADLVNKRLVARTIDILGPSTDRQYAGLQLRNEFNFDWVTFVQFTWTPSNSFLNPTTGVLASTTDHSQWASAHWEGRAVLPRITATTSFLKLTVQTGFMALHVTGWALTAPTTP